MNLKGPKTIFSCNSYSSLPVNGKVPESIRYMITPQLHISEVKLYLFCSISGAV